MPSELLSIVGKKEVTRSLGTKDAREAKLKYVVVAEEVSREWWTLSQKPVPLPHRLIMSLAGEAYDWENIIRLQRAETGYRGLAIGPNIESLEKCIGQTVDQILRRNGLKADEDSRKRGT